MRGVVANLVVASVLVLAAFWWITEPRPAASPHINALAGDAQRGKTFFDAGGCASCHQSPGQSDRLALGGGLELKTPFGVFVVPNISSHPVSGIGKWTTADLANAMKAGLSPNGSHYYPAFPFTTYAHMRDQDIADLMAFLRRLPPLDGKIRPHDLSFPFNYRRLVGAWKLLYLDQTEIIDDPKRSQEWNRGRYLVEGLAHCAECHSARTILGGIDETYRYAGGPDPEGKGMIPNITPHKSGIGSWSKADLVEVLTTGLTPAPDEVSGSMAEVVKNVSELSKQDREAMAEYIKSLSPRESPPKKSM